MSTAVTESGRRSMRAVWTTAALLSALVCAPLFLSGGRFGGYLLHRDAVATPRTPLTAAAFGIDGAPPRAVPQDGALAVASQAFDGGLLLSTILTLSVLLAGAGFGRLALRLVPWSGGAGAVAATVAGIWNPWVAERLLQGHWSLLTGYAALGWIACAAMDLGHDPVGWRRWATLTAWFAFAGFTPTGSLLALIVAIVCAAPRRWAPLAGFWLVTAAPWLVASVFADGGQAGVGGAGEFAARAEPGLGTLGSVLGLGGIWNADAVPASRTTAWALVATACLLLVVAAGLVILWRRRTQLPRTAAALAILAGATVILVALAATGPGLQVLDAVLTHTPGAGLLRDTQKYLALAVPLVALAAAAAAGALRTRVPGAFAAAVVALLVAAPLPDLAWGVGGALRPIRYPDDYARVTALVGRSEAAVAVLPSSPMRRYEWNNAPSLSPLPRMLDAPVILGAGLEVDGATVDGPATQRAAQVIAALERGAPDADLARLGVGWIVQERVSTARVQSLPKGDQREEDRHEAEPSRQGAAVYAGTALTVYRIDAATGYPTPSTAAWAATLTAHTLWALSLLGGIAAAVAGPLRRRRQSARAISSTRANSSAVADQE